MSIPQLEAAIVARLNALLKDIDVPLVRQVYTQAEYAAVPELSMVTPSVAVVYMGYHLGDAIQPARAIQEVSFDWLVVTNVRNATNPASGSGARGDAGPIIDATLEALLGWKPLPKFKPLRLEPAPGAAVADAGFAYYPVGFSTAGTYRGLP